MTTQPAVYIDATALAPEVGLAASTPSAAPSPEAAAAIDRLTEAGHMVVLLDPPAELPADAEGWLLTRDEAVCARAREVRRLRTILVGPAEPGRGLAHQPSDVAARDLRSAVITILTEDAMA